MAREDEQRHEGVYGENIDPTKGKSVSGIREETVDAHPQPTGDSEINPDGADTTSEPETTVAEDLDSVREDAANVTSHGGMGRNGTPRNTDEDTQGEFGGGVDDESSLKTPG